MSIEVNRDALALRLAHAGLQPLNERQMDELASACGVLQDMLSRVAPLGDTYGAEPSATFSATVAAR